MDIANILVSLNKRNNNDYQFVVYGNPTTEEEFKENVNFVSESYTWAEVQTEKPLAEFDYSMEELRKKRNNLLNQTDYIVIKAKETGGTLHFSALLENHAKSPHHFRLGQLGHGKGP